MGGGEEEADEAPAESATTGAEKAGDDGNAAEAANAAKDADAETAARADCPEALKGKDEADRIIASACETVKVEGNYSVEGATLTIEAGVKLVFADGAKMTVGYYEPSKLIINGTEEKPVVLESAGDKAPGVWKGLRLYGKANRSKISHLTVRHAGSDDDGAVRIDGEDVEVSGLVIEDARKLGLRVESTVGFKLSGSKIAAEEGPAIRTTPVSAGGIAADNRFAEEGFVEIPRGSLEESITLHAIPAPWRLSGKLQVNGKDGSEAALNVDAGARIQMGPDASLEVGYYQPARINALGTAEAPIVFEAVSGEEARSWKFLAVYGKGAGKFEHVEFKAGGDENKGTLFANSKAKLSVDHTTFTSSDPAIVLDGNDVELEKLSNTTFSGTVSPIRATPRVYGGVGTGNVYDDGARIHLERGTVDVEATWVKQDAEIELDGDLAVDKEGELTVEAGARFVVEDGVKINVGYYDRASLVLAGTADAPITFVGIREEAGVWGPITVYGKAAATKFEHTTLSHAKGESAILVKPEGSLEASNLSCTDCEGKTLSWTCKSDVKTEAVAGAAAPAGCK